MIIHKMNELFSSFFVYKRKNGVINEKQNISN